MSVPSFVFSSCKTTDQTEIIDKWAANADDEMLSKMDEVFFETAKFEYAFWEYGYYDDE